MNKQQKKLIKMQQDIWRYNYIEQEDYNRLLQDPVYKHAVDSVRNNPIWQRELGLWREPPVEYEENGEKKIYVIPEIRVKTRTQGGSNGNTMTVVAYRHEPTAGIYSPPSSYSYVRGHINNGKRAGNDGVLQCASSRSNDGACTRVPYKGLGRELYKELIEQARQLDKRYESDNSLSPYGFKAYQNLIPDGYDVTVNPYNRNGGVNDTDGNGQRRPHNPTDSNNSPYDQGGVVTITPPGIFRKRVAPTNFYFQHAVIHELKVMHDQAKKCFALNSAHVQAYKEVSDKLIEFLDKQEQKNYENRGNWDATKCLYKKMRALEYKLQNPIKKKTQTKVTNWLKRFTEQLKFDLYAPIYED